MKRLATVLCATAAVITTGCQASEPPTHAEQVGSGENNAHTRTTRGTREPDHHPEKKQLEGETTQPHTAQAAREAVVDMFRAVRDEDARGLCAVLTPDAKRHIVRMARRRIRVEAATCRTAWEEMFPLMHPDPTDTPQVGRIMLLTPTKARVDLERGDKVQSHALVIYMNGRWLVTWD